MKIIDKREWQQKQKQKGTKRVVQFILKVWELNDFIVPLCISLVNYFKRKRIIQVKPCCDGVLCLKTWYLLSFGMFLNTSFKMTTSFINVARTTASTIKFIYQERFKIIRNWVFVWKIIFNFEWIKNLFNVKISFTRFFA